MMTISKHAKKRIKERLGLPKRAHARHINKVVHNGMLHSRLGVNIFKVIYHDFIYIFCLDRALSPILICPTNPACPAITTLFPILVLPDIPA